MIDARGSGLLLHISSLPSKYGIGDFGEGAYRFIDFLQQAGQKYWQILPLVPVGYGESPYQGLSAFAGNHLFIDIDALVRAGLLLPSETFHKVIKPSDSIDYQIVNKNKTELLKKAFIRFNNNRPDDYEKFLEDNRDWIFDYSLYNSVKWYYNMMGWNNWEKSIAKKDPHTIGAYRKILDEEINFNYFRQYIFWKQWMELKGYAEGKNIKIIGDMPLFVSYDSSDVWNNRDMFLLDEGGNPKAVGGVPPDYFSKDGQLWGNPLYNWGKMKDNGYLWWIKRMEKMMEMYHMIRIDHFRGLESYWAIPKGAKTAATGQWVKGPGEDLFKKIKENLGDIPVIAEDLGTITPEVKHLREKLGFPGMKVLQFAIESGNEEEIIPQNHPEDIVIYTGTHDNDTILGWYKGQLERKAPTLKYIRKFYHIDSNMVDKEICWKLIEIALSSNAILSIIPVQDILCLDSSGRMNKPGMVGGNWRWRLLPGLLSEEQSFRLKELTDKYKR